MNECSVNPGNFKALLQLQIESGDSILWEHFESGPQNAQYYSPTIQNELIATISEWFQRKIITAVCNRWTGLLDWKTGMDYWNNL